MDLLQEKDVRIFREKSRAFCGSYKIQLGKLQPEGLPYNPRQLDKNNVSRLVNVFQNEGCLRRQPENHVPALISRACLATVPRKKEADLQVLELNNAVVYLHGRHRIEAAQKVFLGSERWWMVDLYSDG